MLTNVKIDSPLVSDRVQHCPFECVQSRCPWNKWNLILSCRYHNPIKCLLFCLVLRSAFPPANHRPPPMFQGYHRHNCRIKSDVMYELEMIRVILQILLICLMCRIVGAIWYYISEIDHISNQNPQTRPKRHAPRGKGKSLKVICKLISLSRYSARLDQIQDHTCVLVKFKTV